MATLALSAAGSAAGSSLLPGGISFLGTTLSGSAIGTQIGTIAGSAIDQALFSSGGQTRPVEGPRLKELRITASTEGAPIPRLYGSARLGGQVIWAQDIEEVVEVDGGASGGGKGGVLTGGGARGGSAQITYNYFASFAVAICEGEISGIGRIWADGQEFDKTDIDCQIYNGSQSQQPDPLISAAVDNGVAPAFRGVAYIVFERLAIGQFGNRLPQLSFEVFRPLDPFQSAVRGVVMIPGSGEFVYGTTPVTRTGTDGEQVADNVHTRTAATDFLASLDQLNARLPNAKSVSLIVSWFGTDLRASHCQIRPGVDIAQKQTEPSVWRVSDTDRSNAHLVSTIDDRAAFGGTPSDHVVVEAIREMNERGHRVMLTPFILMDIGQDNDLDDPYAPGRSQPNYPWRGRITLNRAPDVSGTSDQTAAATTELSAFIGAAQVNDFTVAGTSVRYHGPAEWSLRRQVLHYAHLAKAAGGIDAFLLSSELRALTQVRSSRTAFPFVEALIDLAADVRAILGPDTKISYAADWSEYFGYHPQDGRGDVLFHLDPLWASPNIDAIGVDLYWPLSDWRHDKVHEDRSLAPTVYDRDYLINNLKAGEGFDWFYASQSDRDAQRRTPITDGLEKPWTFRFKDFEGWWSNPHYDRIGGVEASRATAWVAKSKPFWLTEVGCPAVDLGANQPNVFVDPKSSESAVPYYSSGQTDELMQRRYIEAVLYGFGNSASDSVDRNPISPLYEGAMVDLDRIYLYAWDARPFPAFPHDTETWGDGANWHFGHWLNGRAEANGLDVTIQALASDFAEIEFDTRDLNGLVAGLVVDRIMSLRDALQPLELAEFIDFAESGGVIKAIPRSRGRSSEPIVRLTFDDLVEAEATDPLARFVRMQETELPQRAKLSYISRNGRYASEIAEAQVQAGRSARVSQANLALMLDSSRASEIAESWLREAWLTREKAKFSIPPSHLALEPGDLVELESGRRTHALRVTEIADKGAREIDARASDACVYDVPPSRARPVVLSSKPIIANPVCAFLDLPLLTDEQGDTDGFVAVSQAPWPGTFSVLNSASGTSYSRAAEALASATMGTLTSVLRAGPLYRFDLGQSFEVQLTSGALQSVTDAVMLDGANAAAIEVAPGRWEILQFASAELIGPREYRLSRLLRGQVGSDHEVQALVPAGATFVLLDNRLVRLALQSSDLRRPINWRVGLTGKGLGNPNEKSRQHAFVGVGQRPLAPVHVRGLRDAAGVHIDWIRRTRRGGDNWEQLEVPLAEEQERYEIDILHDGSVVRTLQSSTTGTLYATATAQTDFGEVPQRLTFAVAQVSATFGRGATTVAEV